MFGTKEAMVVHAENRVADLKARGFEQAGLYDPQGVGGTHVMYVLPHADQPELYGGLPRDPRISPIVQWWRGDATLVGAGLMAFAAVASFVHYLTVGPDETPGSAEDKARNEADNAAGIRGEDR
jgi:formate dehydrogenase iron-sulfur subunit